MGYYKNFNQRLHNELRFDAYTLHREEVKRRLPFLAPDANPKALGWRVASFRFQPLDGSQHEIPMTDQIQDVLNGMSLPMLATKADEPAIDDPDEPYLDGNMGARALGKNDWAKLGLPEPEKLSKGGNFIYYEKGHQHKTLEKKLERVGTWAELHEKIDRKKRCTPHQMISFVFEHMKVPPHLIDLSDVPSSGAAAYLQECQDNPVARADFMKSLYPKIIPDKKQLEHEAKSRDTGRRVLEKLEAFDLEFAEDPTILKMEGVA